MTCPGKNIVFEEVVSEPSSCRWYMVDLDQHMHFFDIVCRMPNECQRHRDGIQRKRLRLGEVISFSLEGHILLRWLTCAVMSNLIFGNIHCALASVGFRVNCAQNFLPICSQCASEVRKII